MDGSVKETGFTRLTEAQVMGACERWVDVYTLVSKISKDEE